MSWRLVPGHIYTLVLQVQCSSIHFKISPGLGTLCSSHFDKVSWIFFFFSFQETLRVLKLLSFYFEIAQVRKKEQETVSIEAQAGIGGQRNVIQKYETLGIRLLCHARISRCLKVSCIRFHHYGQDSLQPLLLLMTDISLFLSQPLNTHSLNTYL